MHTIGHNFISWLLGFDSAISSLLQNRGTQQNCHYLLKNEEKVSLYSKFLVR